MKRFVLGVVLGMTVMFVLGLFWGSLYVKYFPEEFGEDLEIRDHEIENLKDSIRSMQRRLDIYDQAAKWFREADSEELQRGIEQIRSVPKDVPLP